MLKDIARQINEDTKIFASLVNEEIHIHLQYDFGPEDERSTFEFELDVSFDGKYWQLYVKDFKYDVTSGECDIHTVATILDAIKEYCVSCY